ncbi:unnamed protein product [Prorocentrum cordatum]|uniref:EF-hand domain-containing protein n=1 Tax=Prorocentrum cordatum TaxID=2364126 RepID=A0ABN9U5N9_9DINO|nr:unnamed protein product [Polarella glacialis]
MDGDLGPGPSAAEGERPWGRPGGEPLSPLARVGSASSGARPRRAGSASSGRGAASPGSEEQEVEAWVRGLWRSLHRGQEVGTSISRSELDREEFHNVITSAVMDHRVGGAVYERAQMNMANALNLILNKADSNCDQMLSFDEFRSFLRFLWRNPHTEVSAELVFALFDVDSSLSIDKTEFREMLKFFLGRNPTQMEFEQEWGRLAIEGQEVVTRAQYTRWLQASSNPVFSQYAPARAAQPLSGSRQATKGTAIRDRPRWNKRFNTGVTPGHVNDILPYYRRDALADFSEHMSVAELDRFYQTYSGFTSNRAKLYAPKRPTPAPALVPKSLSTGVRALMTLPGRHSPGGSMRAHTGRKPRSRRRGRTTS